MHNKFNELFTYKVSVHCRSTSAAPAGRRLYIVVVVESRHHHHHGIRSLWMAWPLQ